MPEPPQLAPLNAEEQQVYSEQLSDVWAPHPISKETNPELEQFWIDTN